MKNKKNDAINNKWLGVAIVGELGPELIQTDTSAHYIKLLMEALEHINFGKIVCCE